MTSNWRTDKDDNAVIVNGQRIKVVDENGEMRLDHVSSMDGYAAFSSGENNIAIHFME